MKREATTAYRNFLTTIGVKTYNSFVLDRLANLGQYYPLRLAEPDAKSMVFSPSLPEHENQETYANKFAHTRSAK